MLEHSTNFEQMLDEVLVKALPYLIFSPPEFSERLAKSMAGMWQSYEDRYRSNAFPQNYDFVMNMLSCPESSWDSVIAQRIRSFERERTSLWMRLQAMEHRLDELEKKPTKPNITVHPTIKTTAQPLPNAAQSVTPMSVKSGRPPKHQGKEYPEEMRKLKMLLEANQMNPRTMGQYVSIATGILEKYDGELPTVERYRADAALDFSSKNVSNHLSVLRRLREACDGQQAHSVPQSGVEQKIGPASVPEKVDPLKVEHETVPEKIPPMNKESTATPPNPQVGTRRIKRMKQMAEHYREGDVFTWADVLTLTGNATERALRDTLWRFSRSGYAEKLPERYTYKRTGKPWDESTVE
jgi:hypothetical protein